MARVGRPRKKDYRKRKWCVGLPSDLCEAMDLHMKARYLNRTQIFTYAIEHYYTTLMPEYYPRAKRRER